MFTRFTYIDLNPTRQKVIYFVKTIKCLFVFLILDITDCETDAKISLATYTRQNIIGG